MKLIDVHCHLESEELRINLDKLIPEARNAGIIKLITSPVSPNQWDHSAMIAEKYDEVEFALGIHPWLASLSDLEIIETLANAKKKGAVAIGEIGLDKKIDNPDIDTQIKAFDKQLEIAKKIDLPVIIHCRGAFNELIQSIQRIGLPASGGIIHSFSGSIELADEFISYGLSFSLGGALTYKKNNKRIKILKRIYPEHFLLETDSPDFLPVQLKDIPNVPANILYNLEAAAEILGESEESVAQVTTENALRLFNFDLK